jgi:hypothetical protein
MQFVIKTRCTPDTMKWHTGCGPLRLKVWNKQQGSERL